MAEQPAAPQPQIDATAVREALANVRLHLEAAVAQAGGTPDATLLRARRLATLAGDSGCCGGCGNSGCGAAEELQR